MPNVTAETTIGEGFDRPPLFPKKKRTTWGLLTGNRKERGEERYGRGEERGDERYRRRFHKMQKKGEKSVFNFFADFIGGK